MIQQRTPQTHGTGRHEKMAEYIEKQAALKEICDACGIVPDREKENCEYKFAGCKEYYNVFALPPADVRPVVRGEWIDDGCITRCKYCGEEKEFPHWRFCPNCGAYLRR